MKSSPLPPSYDPQGVENKWYTLWEKGGYFAPKENSSLPPYSIIMPPPNVTGKLHAGHALDCTTQDILIRFRRMRGHPTLFIPGMDHAGIATQNVVEQEIYREEKKTPQDYGREAFVEKIWKWKEVYGGIISKQQRLMGVSADWNYFLFTMDEEANEAVVKAFVTLYNEGLIQQADYIVNWDTVLKSAISDAEVEYREIQGFYYHIGYDIVGAKERVEIATTRPETLLGDTALCVHPQDERYRHLVGRRAIVPLCEREVPIIADTFVDRQKGTGCLKVTPGHDFNDFDLGRRHNLPTINILNDDGTLNDRALGFAGLTVQKARVAVVEKLEEEGRLIGRVAHTHAVGHGDRSGSVIEPRISKQWFLRVREMAAKALEVVEKDQVRFWPREWENTYYSWMRNPRDWCISRQLWWGHRIPVFFCQSSSCGHSWASERKEIECPRCHGAEVVQEEDVLDTWFSSGLWPLSTLGWPSPEEMAEKKFNLFFPTSTLVTGFDIIFFWVARMVMMSLKLQGAPPFRDIYIHAIVRDKHGRKMSKSLGNGIDPMEMVRRYGACAFRFALASGSGYNRDLNLDPKRIEGYRNFVNKIWNAFRFIHPFLGQEPTDMCPKDLDHQERWILSELNETTRIMNDSLEIYRFDRATQRVYQFIYEKFCSWFIELSKPVLYGDEPRAKAKRVSVLRHSFREIVAILHPFCPFITEELWDHLKGPEEERLIVRPYPEYVKEFHFPEDQGKMNKFIEIVTAVRNLRSHADIPPREKVEVHLSVGDAMHGNYIASLERVLVNLGQIGKVTVGNRGEERPSPSLMEATAHTDIFLCLRDMSGVGKQRAKVERELARDEKRLRVLEKKMNNPAFLKNARPSAVEKVREEVGDIRQRKDSLLGQLKALGSDK